MSRHRSALLVPLAWLFLGISPRPQEPAVRLVAITAGDEFTCALDGEGKAWCWGANGYGQLGAQTTDRCRAVMALKKDPCARRPVLVVGEKRFKVIDAGSYHACGLTADGQAYCWGRNALGELGRAAVPQRCHIDITDNSEPCTFIPLPVETIVRFSAISAGDSFTCAIAVSGEPYCWGINVDGVYGAGNITNGDPRVTRIAGARGLVSVSSYGSQSCGLSRDADVYCWGENISAAATRVPLPEKAASVSRGWGGTCALTISGKAMCWGFDQDGELGLGHRDSLGVRHPPTEVLRAPKFQQVVAGFSTTCGIAFDQTLFCWGSEGTLGTKAADRCFHVDAWSGCQFEPVKVSLEGVSAVTLGGLHGCALAGRGVWCWGYNDAGALGIGSSQSFSQKPVAVDTRRIR